VIPPVLDLLNSTLGFQGTPGAGPNALAAPQAALISALASGVLGGDVRWDLIGIGAVIGILIVILDETLGKSGKMRLPPLGVGMGIYLPMALTMLIPIGALIGHVFNRFAARQKDAERAERLGVLMATGLIVGESLFGVAFAGLIYATDKDAPLAILDQNPLGAPLGLFIFAGTIAWLYLRTRKTVANF
jgi:putative OPT family oligopeptide transporter